MDPDGLVAGMADLIRRTMGPGITVELDLRDGAWGVLCDPNELESALLNLCINARDAMPEGGRLTIGTEDAVLSEGDIAGQGEAAAGDFVARPNTGFQVKRHFITQIYSGSVFADYA